MSKIFKFDTDDLIYNRFDIIHPENVVDLFYDYEGYTYKIQVYINDGIAEPNIWGKSLPQNVFESLINDIFKKNDIFAIKITRGRNQYKNFLEKTTDVRVPLPKSFCIDFYLE